MEGTGTGARFGIPNGAQVWLDEGTGEHWLVYQVPGTEDDPVYMRWFIQSEEDLQSFYGPDQPVVVNETFASDDPMWADAVKFGTTDEIPPGNTAPFAAWVETLETEAHIQPWLMDPDYQKLFAMAVVEGRELTIAELASTDWYSTHSVAERDWMRTYHRDPSEATQILADNRLFYADYMMKEGMGDVDPKLIEYMADRVSRGIWSQLELQRQVQMMTDVHFEGEPLDQDLQNFIDDNSLSYTQTRNLETEVRGVVKQWLGTNFGNWDDATIENWAARMRNDPSALEHLTETLKDQKMAMFPEYDREADYDTIASPWRSMMRNVWGEVPSDSDQTLQSIIKLNDAAEAGKLLTQEGLNRGNEYVVNSVQSDLTNAFGGA